MLLSAAIASLGLSFLFALGGVGSAVALIPALHGLGIDLSVARPIGLLVNAMSLLGASYLNLRSGRIRLQEWVPLIGASLLVAPMGACLSLWVPERILLVLFAVFLGISGPVIFVGPSEGGKREAMPVWMQLFWGSFSGLLSGLLGVGSGGILIPVLCFFGFRSKRIAAITALVVPSASIAGFFTYAQMGAVDLKLTIVCGTLALVGGIAGTQFMNKRLSQVAVRRLLAFLLVILSFKIVIDLFTS